MEWVMVSTRELNRIEVSAQVDDRRLSREQRRAVHQPRMRWECFGELAQIDGSDHRWLEDRAGPCTPLVFLDDATSMLMYLRCVPSENAFGSFETLESDLLSARAPRRFLQ